MKKFLIGWFINTVGILLTAKMIPGIDLSGWKAAVLAALVLGILNVFIKPLIILITLPINIFSLGLFTLFINTFFFYASSRLVHGFAIESFLSAFFGALSLSIVSIALNVLASPFSKSEARTGKRRGPGSAGRGNVIEAEVVPSRDDKELFP